MWYPVINKQDKNTKKEDAANRKDPEWSEVVRRAQKAGKKETKATSHPRRGRKRANLDPKPF